MPEQQNQERERLAGEPTVTPSSDAAITARVEELMRGIKGLPPDDVVVEGETLNPITQLVPDKEKDLKGEPANVIPISTKASHRDSVMGHSLVNKRSSSKRAA